MQSANCIVKKPKCKKKEFIQYSANLKLKYCMIYIHAPHQGWGKIIIKSIGSVKNKMIKSGPEDILRHLPLQTASYLENPKTS